MQAIQPSIKAQEFDLRRAYEPQASVFAAANAGAGKTSLLSSRVLALLLAGVPPGRILCLTYTQAAAAEMSHRVQQELGRWVMQEEGALRASLQKITPHEPDESMLARARGLFAEVLEAPDGIRIQTIHAFCQSLLRRFPLEANVSPHFTLMDDRSEQEVMGEARLQLFQSALKGDVVLADAIAALARGLHENTLHKLFGEIVSHKRRFRIALAEPGGLMRRLWKLSGIAPDSTLESLTKQYFTYDDSQSLRLKQAARILLGGKPTDKKTGEALAMWFENPNQRQQNIDDYCSAFLTEKQEQRTRIFTKECLTDAALIEALMDEQARVGRFSRALRNLEMVVQTGHVLRVAEALLHGYDAIKSGQGWMDYDDLILAARDVLQKPGVAPWILFKLDGGIDHILVDEAQDTSPEQWQIIDALAEEFFAGVGRDKTSRSLFVVGDEKQSIFSFQGAAPAELARMRQYFTRRIEEARLEVHELSLQKSYRSNPAILAAVDAIFAQPRARNGVVSSDSLEHIATKTAQAGLVECWPLLVPAEDDTTPPSLLLARTLADTIAAWIQQGTAQAGDIMILVRTRTSFVDRLVRALKRCGVPVAGHDRMGLNDNLAVQDLVALGQVLLLPEDDLTLAAVLKSPLVGLSEEDLFTLAFGRGGRLWEALGKQTQSPFTEAYQLLVQLRARADYLAPFELYSYLLDTLGARRRITGRMGEEYHDPVNEFLNQCLLYEASHAPSLQGFLHWLAASDSKIKRDMEQSRDVVRIMTVHGAKGLQAPIVIMPDTVSVPDVKDTLLWYLEEPTPLPLHALSASRGGDAYLALRSAAKDDALAEYRRLFYVALTRAENRLYLCGASGRESISDDCWYQLAKQGIAPIAERCDTPLGEGLRVGELQPFSKAKLAEDKIPTDGEDFSYLLAAPPFEPNPPQPLAPSRLTATEPAAASPRANPQLHERGILIHALLQFLPDAESEVRDSMAVRIAARFAPSLEEAEIQAAIREAMAVMVQSEFAALFAKGALVEVPVTGVVEIDGKSITVSGQIDRLCIHENEVWIIDYKSNRQPPKAVPPAYLAQLRLYQLLLQAIYPAKTMRCGLLWTALPRLEMIPQAHLDETPASSYI